MSEQVSTTCAAEYRTKIDGCSDQPNSSHTDNSGQTFYTNDRANFNFISNRLQQTNLLNLWLNYTVTHEVGSNILKLEYVKSDLLIKFSIKPG